MKTKKEFIITLTLSLLCLSLVLASIGCTSQAGADVDVVGKWKIQGGLFSRDVEFFKDGTLSWEGISGKYTFPDPGRMKIELAWGFATVVTVYKYSLSGDILTLDDEQGTVYKLQRTK